MDESSVDTLHSRLLGIVRSSALTVALATLMVTFIEIELYLLSSGA